MILSTELHKGIVTIAVRPITSDIYGGSPYDEEGERIDDDDREVVGTSLDGYRIYGKPADADDKPWQKLGSGTDVNDPDLLRWLQSEGFVQTESSYGKYTLGVHRRGSDLEEWMQENPDKDPELLHWQPNRTEAFKLVKELAAKDLAPTPVRDVCLETYPWSTPKTVAEIAAIYDTIELDAPGNVIKNRIYQVTFSKTSEVLDIRFLRDVEFMRQF